MTTLGFRAPALCSAALCLAAAPGVAACGTDDGGIPVTIQVAGKVGAQAFRCGEVYAGIGRSRADVITRDFRFYLHGIRLVRSDGSEVPLALDQDGRWQHEGTVLIDLEDGEEGCDAGDPETNTAVEGTVPEGTYTGLRFVLGVPLELNHVEADVAPPPLDVEPMFRSREEGHLHLRIDGTSSGLPDGWQVHLRSSGCSVDAMGNVTSCAHGNRPQTFLDGFNPNDDVLVADMARLLDGADMNANAMDTPPGCTSTPDDGDCAPIFNNLGLSFAGSVPGPQRFFRME